MIVDFIAGFFLKAILVVLVAVILYPRMKTVSGSLVCGWLISYESLIALMLGLSCFKMVNKTGLVVGIITIIIGGYVLCYKYSSNSSKQLGYCFFRDVAEGIRNSNIIEYVIGGGIILFSIYIIGHNSLFFDSTWDAHTYQIPRIELLTQKETLFVNMTSRAMNIFSNEWNGELNAIFYTIMCSTNQGMFLANAENIIYSFLAVYWFCNKIGLKHNNILMAMLWYCSMPVVVFLAMVVKGDFIAIPFFMITVIWLKEYIETKSQYALFFLIIGGSLAAGSKISLVPFFGLCMVSVIAYLFADNKGNIVKIFQYLVNIWKILLVGIMSAMIGCARYFLNFIFYGEFFKRVDGERMVLSLQCLKVSLLEMVKTLIFCDNMFTQEGNVNALNMDMGIIGVVFTLFFLPTAFIYILRHYKAEGNAFWYRFYVWFPIIGSLLFFMSSTTWFIWSFRYYIPWIMVIFLFWVLMLQDIFDNLPKVLKKLLSSVGVWLGIIGIASTIVLTTRFGEVTHSSWKEARQKPMIEREYGFHIYMLESYDGSPDIYDIFNEIKVGKKVLICNAIDTAISYLFGEDNDNEVTFCMPEDIFVKLEDMKYDVVSISDSFMTPEIESYFGNDEWICFMPSNDFVQAHVYIRVQ